MSHKYIFLFCFIVSNFCSKSQKLDSISTFPGFARDDAVAEFFNGKIYCGLGYAVGFQVMGDWWSFDLNSSHWEKYDNVPFEKRQYSSSLVWENFVYVFGGWSSDAEFHKDLWRFNCLTNSWQEMESCPGKARWGTAAVGIGEHAIFGLGQDTASYFKDYWIYDFKMDRWVQASEFPGEGRSKLLALELNGMALLGLGQGKANNFNDLWVFNPLINTWSEIKFDFDSLAYMSYGNFGNTIYLHGGQEFGGKINREFTVMSFENILDPKIVSQIELLPTARGNMILDEHQNVFVLWGLDSNSQRTKSLEQVIYSKNSDTNLKIELFPNPSDKFVLIQANEKIKSLKLLNNMGSVISDQKVFNIHHFKLDVSNLKAGLFYLKVSLLKGGETILPLQIK